MQIANNQTTSTKRRSPSLLGRGAVFLLCLVSIIESVAGLYPHWTPSGSFCTTGNWYLGYNKLAQYFYQAMDLHPSGDYFVVGGSVGDQGSVYGSQTMFGTRRLQASSQGAILLLYPKFGSEPEQVFYVPAAQDLTSNTDNSTYEVNILGVSSIKMSQTGGATDFSGVFSTDLG